MQNVRSWRIKGVCALVLQNQNCSHHTSVSQKNVSDWEQVRWRKPLLLIFTQKPCWWARRRPGPVNKLYNICYSSELHHSHNTKCCITECNCSEEPCDLATIYNNVFYWNWSADIVDGVRGGGTATLIALCAVACPHTDATPTLQWQLQWPFVSLRDQTQQKRTPKQCSDRKSWKD